MKGQGLPLNTIIIAAIGVIVLVVLVVLVQNQITKSSKGITQTTEQTCTSAGGELKPIGTDCEAIYGNFKNSEGKICCRTNSTG